MALIDISIEDYSVKKHKILTDINIAIEEKDCVGLIGLNGAGKTTLLRSLLNFTALQNGSVYINGVAADKPASREDVYYLPEKFNPSDFLTGQEYLDYIVAAYKVPLTKDLREGKYKNLAADMAFDFASLKKKMNQYSKGMMQKIGIMAAILSEKNIWVLDEPMSGLDPQARALFQQVIENAKTANKTIIFCTHLLSDVENLCDNLIAINRGKVAFSGTPQALLAKYNKKNIEQAFLELIRL